VNDTHVTVDTRPYRLRCARVLVTARGRWTHREGWLVRVTDEDGATGWGDVAGWPGFTEDLDALEPALRGLVGLGRTTAEGLRAGRWPVEVEHGLELALLDLEARRRGLSLASLLAGDGPAPMEFVPVHALVNSAVDALDAVHRGYHAVKIKVGAAAVWQDDLTRVGAIRAAVGPHIALRVDANGAWQGDQALRACEWLRSLNPEFIEQPSLSLEDCARVRSIVGVPVALDEAVTTSGSLQAAMDQGALDVAIVKPMFCGGPRAALALARVAAGGGVRVVVTCALESAVGRLGALHVAAALGGPVSGLEAPLAEDVLPLPAAVDGRIGVPVGPGLGYSPR
jgi:o-succinylbenzoate synthase